VFLTADSDRETEVRVFREGALDYIQKPLVPEVVLERIKRILSLRKLQVNLESEVERRTAELEESRRKLQVLSLQVVKTLASAIDAKDRYTNGHSSRVAKYSKEIARRAGKPVEFQDEIYFIALLHDIGKIGIPDYILNKNSKLTDEEYETIKQHPSIGVEILKKITEMPKIEIGAHYHHERFDGKGYPEGLAGYSIPEIGRIIAVADAYDAMTSRRSYRSALPQETVRSEIVRGRGQQFDPDFADVMLQMIDEDVNYTMRDDGLA
jgi:putative two-component system response regulator